MKPTPYEYHQASLIGVSRSTLEARLRRGWDREKAISNPPHVRQDRTPEDVLTPEQIAKAEEYGVNRDRLWRRVFEYGWDIKRAMTEEVKGRGQYKRTSKYGDYTKLAESNGIPFKTFCARINRAGWDLERAATVPVNKKRTTQ